MLKNEAEQNKKIYDREYDKLENLKLTTIGERIQQIEDIKNKLIYLLPQLSPDRRDLEDRQDLKLHKERLEALQNQRIMELKNIFFHGNQTITNDQFNELQKIIYEQGISQIKKAEKRDDIFAIENQVSNDLEQLAEKSQKRTDKKMHFKFLDNYDKCISALGRQAEQAWYLKNDKVSDIDRTRGRMAGIATGLAITAGFLVVAGLIAFPPAGLAVVAAGILGIVVGGVVAACGIGLGALACKQGASEGKNKGGILNGIWGAIKGASILFTGLSNDYPKARTQYEDNIHGGSTFRSMSEHHGHTGIHLEPGSSTSETLQKRQTSAPKPPTKQSVIELQPHHRQGDDERGEGESRGKRSNKGAFVIK